LSFDTTLSGAACSGKAALVRLYYQRDWTTESAAPPRPLPSGGSGGGQFEELVNAAAATVRATNILSSSDKLRFVAWGSTVQSWVGIGEGREIVLLV